MAKIEGVLSAVVTPFTGDNADVDEKGLRALVDRTIDGGVHGLVPCGSTGEFAALTVAERQRVIEIVIEQANGRIPVIPHIGAMATREAISLAKHAEEAGAAAVMAVSPYYEALSIDETKTYFREVAGAIGIPVVLYNLPAATGVNLSPEHVVDLARSAENIQYIKDTSGDFSQAARLIHDHADEIKTLVGWDTLYFAALVEVPAGSIVGAANFIAPQLRTVWDCVQAQDLGQAKAQWAEIFPVMQFLTSGGYVSGVRGALDILGYSVGPARAPIGDLEPARRSELEGLLKNLSA